MKLICPRCLGKKLSSAVGRDTKKDFSCNTCGHTFAARAGLVSLEQAINFGSALDNQTRRSIILQFATEEELAVGELAKALGETIPSISYHVKVLCHSNPPLLIVARSKERAGGRSPIIYYRVNRSL